LAETLDVRYHLSSRDIVIAVAAANRFSKLAAVTAAAGVVGTVFAWLNGDPTWPVGIFLGAGFATGLAPGLIGAWAFSRRPEIATAEIHMEADDAGVRIATQMSQSAATWAVFRRVRETPGEFLLDFGTGAGTFVPKAVMEPADCEALRGLAARAGVLVQGSSWRLPAIGVVIGALLTVGWTLLLGGLFPAA
jgi:hypothetical protein